jgi:hypothetical protein
MGSPQSGGLGSVAQALVLHAPVPVTVVRPGEAPAGSSETDAAA